MRWGKETELQLQAVQIIFHTALAQATEVKK